MSVNYYAVSGDPEISPLHIGHSADSWEFLFRAYRDLGLTSTVEWQEHLSKPGIQIVGDNGRTILLAEFWSNVVQRPAYIDDPSTLCAQFRYPRSPEEWRDSRGYAFAAYKFC
jgi:hypothetical protein